MKRIIALVPMKGHSERIPDKNMKLFTGQPLYHAIIISLEASAYIDTILINTDSRKIEEDAQKKFRKVQLIHRPKELQGDFVPMNDIIAYDLLQTEGNVFLQTHSTNPLLTTKTINASIEKFFSIIPEYDSLFSVTSLQTRLYWKDGCPINHKSKELLRTQDLPPVFEENSNFYLFTRESFKKAGNKRIGLKPWMFEMDKLEAIDIDEPEDFIMAELLYKEKEKQNEIVK